MSNLGPVQILQILCNTHIKTFVVSIFIEINLIETNRRTRETDYVNENWKYHIPIFG